MKIEKAKIGPRNTLQNIIPVTGNMVFVIPNKKLGYVMETLDGASGDKALVRVSHSKTSVAKYLIGDVTVVVNVKTHEKVTDADWPELGSGTVLEIDGHLVKIRFGSLNTLWRDIRTLRMVSGRAIDSSPARKEATPSIRTERNRASRHERAQNEAEAKRRRDQESKASRLATQNASQEAAKKKAEQKAKQKKK